MKTIFTLIAMLFITVASLEAKASAHSSTSYFVADKEAYCVNQGFFVSTIETYPNGTKLPTGFCSTNKKDVESALDKTYPLAYFLFGFLVVAISLGYLKYKFSNSSY